MKSLAAPSFLLVCLFLSFAAKGDPARIAAQQEVLVRLVTNASKKPPGPVENDLPSSVVKASTAFLKMMGSDAPSPHEALASDYSFFTLQGPLLPIYDNATTALASAPVKLSDATLHDPDLPLNADAAPGFGEKVGGCMYLMSKVPPDGLVTGTFCFVLENGTWKVHNFYLSNSALKDSALDFLKQQLEKYNKKS